MSSRVDIDRLESMYPCVLGYSQDLVARQKRQSTSHGQANIRGAVQKRLGTSKYQTLDCVHVRNIDPLDRRTQISPWTNDRTDGALQ